MTGEERNIFEKELQKDSFEAEAMEGLSSISPEEARSDLRDLQQRLSGRTHHKNRFIFYRVAAAAAVIIVFGSLIVMVARLGLFPGQVAVTETTKQEKTEAIPGEEMMIQTDQEKVTPEDEIPRSDLSTGRKTVEERVTESKGQVSISEVPEEDILKEVEVFPDELEISAITEQIEPGLTDKFQGGMVKDEKTEPVVVEEISEFAYVEEAVPPLSAKKARSAGDRKILSGKVRPILVRGVVVSSEDDLPIPGAIVTVKGTSTGTITDYDGNFEIVLQEDTNNTLIAGFIGMESKEIQMSDQQDIRITLYPSESTLDEVVVIGYGIQKEKNVTGAVTIIQPTDNTGYQPASPVTGYQKFREYIVSNLQFPPGDTIHLRTTVVLSFTVREGGRPADIFVVKSPGKAFSDEAIRLLNNGPDWFPPKRNGSVTKEETLIRIVFKPVY